MLSVTLLYILLLNLVAFVAMWWDKRKAKRDEWRIAEATLLVLAYLGGAFGLLLGMYRFRHKTKKRFFQFAAILSIVVSLLLYWYLPQWLIAIFPMS